MIQLSTPPTFETIREHLPKGKQENKEFIYDNKKIKAYRKFTYRNGQLYSQYLNILIENKTYSNGSTLYSHYRENKKGEFIFIQYLND